jgi:hypothetical protein
MSNLPHCTAPLSPSRRDHQRLRNLGPSSTLTPNLVITILIPYIDVGMVMIGKAGGARSLSNAQAGQHDPHLHGRCSGESVYVYLTSSILRTVADVVLGRVVVPPVYLPKPGTVKVYFDGWLFGWITHLVNALFIRQHG